MLAEQATLPVWIVGVQCHCVFNLAPQLTLARLHGVVQGGVEARLSAAAEQLLAAFEALLGRLLQPLHSSTTAADPASPSTSSSLLGASTPAASCRSPLTKSMAAYIQAGPAASAAPPRPVARQLFEMDTTAGSSSSSSMPTSPGAGFSGPKAQGSLAALLVSFDDSWLEYLDQFVVWKGHDARGLETELIRMAIRLERSMRLKLGRRKADSLEVTSNPDLRVSTGPLGQRWNV